jgi:hypothetical protein
MKKIGDTILVSFQELTQVPEGASEAVMTKACYESLCRRTPGLVVRSGKGPGRHAEVDYGLLPSKYHNRFTVIYGDPYEIMRKEEEKEKRQLRVDPAALRWFQDHVLPDGTRLKEDKINEFAANATVLGRLNDMVDAQKLERRKLNNTTPVNWDAIYGEAAILRDLCGHTLPRNGQRLREKMREYRSEGYTCLVSGRLCNSNSTKVTREAGEFLIALKCCRTPVRTNAQIFAKFNQDANKYGFKPLKSEATVTNYLNRPDVKPRWYAYAVGDTAARAIYGRQHSTVLPTLRDSLWYMDGTKMNLFYKEYVDGKYRMATLNVYEVMDAATEVFLGCAFHTGNESFEVMYEAVTAALAFSMHKPCELVSDNQGGTKRADAQEWLSRVAGLFRTTAPHRAPAKTIEAAFGRLQAQYLHQNWNYTGGNITAKGEAAKINREQILANVDALPTREEVKRQYLEARRNWNDAPHPDQRTFAGKSRLEAYMESSNPRSEALDARGLEDLHWILKPMPSTFTAYGLLFQVGGQEYQYEPFDADGNPDLSWRGRNTGREFFVEYNPSDRSAVRLYTKDRYGYRFERELGTYATVHRSLQDQTDEERRFIRQQDERDKVQRVADHMRTEELLGRFGLAPDQHGLRDPGLSGLNESKASYERIAARAAASLEEAPPEVYPDSLGAQEKAESYMTRYDVRKALERL